jgi:GNAT superfamily N-acetyltransferase
VADRSVRPARIEDAGTIAAIQRDVWIEDYAQLLNTEVTFPSVEELALVWADAIRNAPSRRSRVMVATEGPLVVGFAAIAPEDEITDLIDPLHISSGKRRAGHGTRLMTAIADTSKDLGALVLSAWGLEGDHGWTNLLSTLGFSVSGETRSLDLHGDEQVVLLQHKWQAALEASSETSST